MLARTPDWNPAMPDPTDEPTPPPILVPAPPAVESPEERIRRLEEAVSRLSQAVEPPRGYSPGPIIPLSAINPEPELPRRWFFTVLAELKLIARMYLDSRYRLSRIAQFGIPLVLGLMIFNYFLFAYFCFGGIWIISPIAERVGNLMLAVVGYNILRKETVRYRAVLDYLARTGRG